MFSFTKLILTTLVIITVIYSVWGGCPAPALITPCVCKDNIISCGGNSTIDLVEIFEKLDQNLNKSEKHFDSFYLYNKAITEIKSNTTKSITFNGIFIIECYNLIKIDVNAFDQTALVTKNLEISYNGRSLSSQNNTIYEMIRKFINLKNLFIYSNNITEIPDKAFHPASGHQSKLETLVIGGGAISRIGNYAFSSLNSLKYLHIDRTSIDTIPEFAFAFDQASNETLVLKSYGNLNINQNQMGENILDHFKRPVTLVLGYEYYYFLHHKNVLVKFFNANKENKVQLLIKIDCTDCGYYWLKKNPDHLKQIINLKCGNGKNFTDQDNFVECGPREYLYPCKFDTLNNGVLCNGTTTFDLKGVFRNFSKQLPSNKKHYEWFNLFNTAIEELEENVFDEIKFEKINIQGCSSLKRIHKNAFVGTNTFTSELLISGNPVLTSTPNNSIFEILSSFPSIQSIFLSNNDLITEIPSNAFRPINGYQNHLTDLYLYGRQYTKIGNNSFFNLNNLTSIKFSNAQFKLIPDNAFAFKDKSDVKLTIDFYGCPLINSSVFSQKSLINIKRPTNILFGDYDYPKQVTYLDEKVFLPFLLDNENNTIDLKYNAFDCNDCRNYWLKKQPKLVPRLLDIKCSNGNKLLDPGNFENCN